MDDVYHIERCATCGGVMNAQNPQQAHKADDGTWRHNTAYCRTAPMNPRERAEIAWGRVSTLSGSLR
jgi:hypothetical protein